MIFNRIHCYFQLTKPSIMLLVLITGATAVVMEGNLAKNPFGFLLVLIGLFLTGGSANALNQFFEKDIDSEMSRTRKRRPLPLGKIGKFEACTFAVFIGVAGVTLFAVCFNFLSAILSLMTIVFYGFFYTLWLKPNTHQNIVIGGIAGAMAPVIGWAAAANALSVESWLLFLIIFLWTPPHFWALALYSKEDYKRVNLPMLPNVKGDDATIKQILYYSFAMVLASLGFLFVKSGGIFYLIIAVLMGGIFIRKALLVRKYKTHLVEMRLFRYSIIYLFSLFISLIVEGLA